MKSKFRETLKQFGTVSIFAFFTLVIGYGTRQGSALIILLPVVILIVPLVQLIKLSKQLEEHLKPFVQLKVGGMTRIVYYIFGVSVFATLVTAFQGVPLFATGFYAMLSIYLLAMIALRKDTLTEIAEKQFVRQQEGLLN